MHMKRAFLILLGAAGLVSCENFEIDQPDFDYTSGFFPYQFPVRTLILGDYIYDNTNDNAHKFIISVAMGGVYSNDRDRVFDIEVDESLCEDILFNASGDTIRVMPADYYTLSSDNQIVIPAGEMNGGIEVQLTEAFFNDTLAIKLGYVVPIRLRGSADVDSILNGRPNSSASDPRVGSDWSIVPKNFTMFAVKYINEYHGTYFHYGESSLKDNLGTTVEDSIYSEKYVVNNATTNLVTTGRHEVALSTNLRSAIFGGSIDMLLHFDGNTCTISAAEGSLYTISGTGEFKEDAYSWGNKSRNGIELHYTVSDGSYTYEASEVLVIRDRGVVMEVFNPQLIEE